MLVRWLVRSSGTSVRVQNLVAAQHLNGQTSALEKFDLDQSRWQARLDDGSLRTCVPKYLQLQDAVAEHDQIVVPKQTTGAEREARVGNHVRPNRSELTEAVDDELPRIN